MLPFAACLPGWSSFGGHCYKAFQKQRFTWSAASSNCRNKNSEMVSIWSHNENQFVSSLINSSWNCSWIGLRFFQNELHWLDGSKGNFTKWHNPPAQQNTSCVAFFESTGLWTNISCSTMCYFICKRRGESEDGV